MSTVTWDPLVVTAKPAPSLWPPVTTVCSAHALGPEVIDLLSNSFVQSLYEHFFLLVCSGNFNQNNVANYTSSYFYQCVNITTTVTIFSSSFLSSIDSLHHYLSKSTRTIRLKMWGCAWLSKWDLWPGTCYIDFPHVRRWLTDGGLCLFSSM